MSMLAAVMPAKTTRQGHADQGAPQPVGPCEGVAETAPDDGDDEGQAAPV